MRYWLLKLGPSLVGVIGGYLATKLLVMLFPQAAVVIWWVGVVALGLTILVVLWLVWLLNSQERSDRVVAVIRDRKARRVWPFSQD